MYPFLLLDFVFLFLTFPHPDSVTDAIATVALCDTLVLKTQWTNGFIVVGEIFTNILKNVVWWPFQLV